MNDDIFVDDPFEEVAPVVEADAQGLMRQAVDVVSTARTMPLSASVLVARDELLELLQTALDLFPDELRQARWLLRERDEFLATRQREADNLLEEVRAQAERMVQRTEIVRQSEHRSLRLVEEAEAEARRLRHEADDYIDQKLAGFEIVLDRTMTTVRNGRERLAAVPADNDEADAGYGRGRLPGAEPGGLPGSAAARTVGGNQDAGGGGGGPDQDDFFDQDSG